MDWTAIGACMVLIICMFGIHRAAWHSGYRLGRDRGVRIGVETVLECFASGDMRVEDGCIVISDELEEVVEELERSGIA